MKKLVTLSIACSVALAACSRAVAPSYMPSPLANGAFPLQKLSPSGYRTLYNFDDSSGGGTTPYGGVIEDNGTLYGMTHGGGFSSACVGGCGTAYSLTTAGAQTELYSFGSYKGDGMYPVGELLNIDGTFYGTTRAGGSSKACSMGCGTVFSLDKVGKEHVLYSFGSYRGDATSPRAGMIGVAGTLYGTTETGGSKNRGTVFAFSITSGRERVIYTFGSYKGDGLYPVADLTNLHGILYGTTLKGGSYNAGTAFRVLRKSGRETTIHSFGGGPDGAFPAAGLTFAQGSLYGTTTGGGTLDGGTVFVMTASGIEGVLYSFGKKKGDGKNPQASLTPYPGVFLTLYGTTARGGAHGKGSIFSITGSGAEQVQYSFAGSNGATPYARLLLIGKRLYSTTANGGSGKCSGPEPGCGTAFVYAP